MTAKPVQIRDAISLLAYIVNAPLSSLFVATVGGEELVYCARWMRSHPKDEKWLKKYAESFDFYTSWKSFIATRDGRWRSGRLRCKGCGRSLKHHKP